MGCGARDIGPITPGKSPSGAAVYRPPAAAVTILLIDPMPSGKLVDRQKQLTHLGHRCEGI